MSGCSPRSSAGSVARLVKALVALEVLAIVATGGSCSSRRSTLVGLPDVLMGTSLVLVSVGWLLGASAIGADWHAGHVTTILSWEPDAGASCSRRSRPR